MDLEARDSYANTANTLFVISGALTLASSLIFWHWRNDIFGD